MNPEKLVSTIVDALEDIEGWVRLGLLSVVGQTEPRVPSAQLGRLKALAHHSFGWNDLPGIPDMLFSPTVACALGNRTCLVEGDVTKADDPVVEFLKQHGGTQPNQRLVIDQQYQHPSA